MVSGRPLRQQPVFNTRYEAGKALAQKLGQYHGGSPLVLAILNGGLPIAVPVALSLRAELDVVVARKLPIPLNPEGGFGAVADDGTTILNQDLVKQLHLSDQQVAYQIATVREDIRKRSLLYRGNRLLVPVSGKTVIIVDDGLASGYTMLAAVESVRRRHPARIVVAIPVASAMAVNQVGRVVEEIVTVVTSFTPQFFVSDYFRYWDELTDEEGLRWYRKWRQEYLQGSNIPQKGFKAP